MAVENDKPRILNRIALGDYIAEKRRKAGFKNREEFSRAIEEKTSLIVSPETIKRIERGEGLPSLEVFFAISVVAGNGHSWELFIQDSIISCQDGWLELERIQDSIVWGYRDIKECRRYLNEYKGDSDKEAERYLKFYLSELIEELNRSKADLIRVTAYTAQDKKLKHELENRLVKFEKDIIELEQWGRRVIRAKPAR